MDLSLKIIWKLFVLFKSNIEWIKKKEFNDIEHIKCKQF